MEFGIINYVNALIVVFILIPNIIYAMKGGEDHKADNGVVTFLEQVGRYASIAMMILPLGVWKFGFPNVLALLVYLAGDMVLLIGYWIAWGSYIKKKTYSIAMILAVIPVCIFLVTGFCLHHWLLCACAVVFGCCHIYITRQNEKSPPS